VTSHENEGNSRRTRLWRVLRPVLIILASLIVGYLIVNFFGAIDWAQVGSSLGRLSFGAFVLLIALLLLRQTFNAVPLSRFVPGLALPRSMQNDLTANVVATFTPPPSDVVLRVSMFKSWHINPVDGMAGVALNTLTFYAVRFFAPALGVVLLAFQEVERGQIIAASLSTLVAVAVIAAIWLIARGDRFAALLGFTAGRVVRRFRSSVQPQEWADSVVSFRARMEGNLRTGLLPALAALLTMVVIDSLILLSALRFVGIDSSVLSTVDILGAFFIVYPLTLMPMAGLGILDAALIGTWVTIATIEWEPEIIAGLVVWRVITILGTLALGAISLGVWRGTTRAERSAEA
jgi:putative heme transporter